jgi:hypothetical protein
LLVKDRAAKFSRTILFDELVASQSVRQPVSQWVRSWNLLNLSQLQYRFFCNEPCVKIANFEVQTYEAAEETKTQNVWLDVNNYSPVAVTHSDTVISCPLFHCAVIIFHSSMCRCGQQGSMSYRPVREETKNCVTSTQRDDPSFRFRYHFMRCVVYPILIPERGGKRG